MGTLAEKLENVQVKSPRKIPKTPCFPIYGYGDEEDRQAIDRLHDTPGVTWEQVQEIVDEKLGVASPLPNYKFIRHWRKGCSCWDDE